MITKELLAKISSIKAAKHSPVEELEQSIMAIIADMCRLHIVSTGVCLGCGCKRRPVRNVEVSYRTKAGLATARAQGKRLGRPAVHAGITQKVLELSAGRSISGIVKVLAESGVTISRETVRRVLVAARWKEGSNQ